MKVRLTRGRFGWFFGWYFQQSSGTLFVCVIPSLVLRFECARRRPCYHCGSPADMLCVPVEEKKNPTSARDPLCFKHGGPLGPCRHGNEWVHVAIPDRFRYYYGVFEWDGSDEAGELPL